MYSTCIQCFNKKVRCVFCNKELNKNYLRSHVKKQHIKNQHIKNQYSNQDDKRTGSRAASHNDEAQEHLQLRTRNITVGDLLPTQLPTKLNNDNNNDDNNNECNKTLIVGPSFCGKTHLLLNKLQLIRLSDSEKQIKMITRSPGQYLNIQLGDAEGALHVSVEEDLEDRTIQDFKNCCVIFDDMLESNQKLIDPFLLGEDTICVMFII